MYLDRWWLLEDDTMTTWQPLNWWLVQWHDEASVNYAHAFIVFESIHCFKCTVGSDTEWKILHRIGKTPEERMATRVENITLIDMIFDLHVGLYNIMAPVPHTLQVITSYGWVNRIVVVYWLYTVRHWTLHNSHDIYPSNMNYNTL